MSGDHPNKKGPDLTELTPRDLLIKIITDEVDLRACDITTLLTLRGQISIIRTDRLSPQQLQAVKIFKESLNARIDELTHSSKEKTESRPELEAWVTAEIGKIRQDIFLNLRTAYKRYQPADYLAMLDYASQEIRGLTMEDITEVKNPDEYKQNLLSTLKSLFGKITNENQLRDRCLALARITIDKLFPQI